MLRLLSRCSLIFVLPALLTVSEAAEEYIFTTLAGSAGSSGSVDGKGSAARFNQPNGVAVDSAGNVFVSDANNYSIREITPDGVVSTLAGQAGNYGFADGTGSVARFGIPSGVAVDSAGNVYVTDILVVRKITPGRVVSTLAGQLGPMGSADGQGSAARFNMVMGVALDSVGNVYVADYGNHTIRKITPAGVVSTLAGQAGISGSTDGTGSAARFNGPMGVAVDSAGNLYVADEYNHTIRKITPAGVVSTLAGQAGISGSRDGIGSAGFTSPRGVAVDSAGNVYVMDNTSVRKITPGRVVSTLAGPATGFGSTDGTGKAVQFRAPVGIAVDGAGNLYVADTGNHTIRKGTLTTVAPTAAPAIAVQPQSQTVAAGTNATFTVTASGTAPLSYQWQKGGTNLVNGGRISGVTIQTLTLTTVTTNDAASYSVVVSNSVGSVTSAVAVLTVTGVSSGVFSIADDFNDGVLNQSLWTTFLPFGDSIAREESGGFFHLGGAGSLIPKAEFNPANGPITLTARVKTDSVNDVFYFRIRVGDLPPAPPNGILITGGVGGVEGGLCGIQREGNGAGVLALGTHAMSVGNWYDIRITDDGTNVTLYVDNQLVISAVDTTVFATNHVVLLNRPNEGWMNNQMYLDSVGISGRYDVVVSNLAGSVISPVAEIGVDVPGMVWVPPGVFRMGSPETEAGRGRDEGPVTTMRLSRGFWMGKYEVTQSEFESVMGNNPGRIKGGNLPVSWVSWVEATNYCGKLTAREQLAGRIPAGYRYRLPTEAEWEYACRAGTTTRFSFGDSAAGLDDVGWHGGNSGGIPQMVGQKQGNAWELCDLHGNVGEWCAEWYAAKLPGGEVADATGPERGTRRVFRGGSYADGAELCRSAERDGAWPVELAATLGFRVVLGLEPVVGPEIVVQPAGKSVNAGETVVLSVVARGTEPLSYRWQKDRADLVIGPGVSGSATASLTLSWIYSKMKGQYRVVVTDMSGQVASAEADVKVAVVAPANMVWIPPGTFSMGSPASEVDLNSNEKPQTQVTLTKGFWMGKYEVTQWEYLDVMGSTVGLSILNGPVIAVRWSDASSHCAKVTERERQAGRLPAGYVYRLPTEAEWEYACRAGTTTRFSYGDDPNYTYLGQYAWYFDNTKFSWFFGVFGTHIPVGTKLPNPWGLYDMHGNEGEWCLDWFGPYPGGSITDPRGPTMGSIRVTRGGNYNAPGGACRSAFRFLTSPDDRFGGNGFRLVLAPSQ